MNKDKELFVLIDSNALIHRAFHAFPSTLSTSTGELVNAVYGFSSMLLRVLEELDPTYIACAFDLPKPTFRHLEYVGYKKNRPAPDPELVPQFDKVRQVVEALNIPMFQVEGYEADDVIGTLCRQIDELDPKNQVNTIVVTGDKDILQLVDANTKVWLPGKSFKDMQLYGVEEVENRFGFAPRRIIDFKAIAGDPSDQIPGVKGIGEKGATTLIQEFGELESIYENLDKVNTRHRKKLEDEQESAFLSKKLATIITDVPIKLDYNKAVVVDYDYKEAYEIFQRFEFRSLIKKLPKSINGDKRDNQIGLFQSADSSKKTKSVEDVIVVKSVSDFGDVLKNAEGPLYLDLVYTKKAIYPSRLGIMFGGKKFSVLPSLIEKDDEVAGWLKALVESHSCQKIGYDIKRMMHFFDDYDIKLEDNYWDIQLAAYLLGKMGNNQTFSALSFAYEGIMFDEFLEDEDKISEFSSIRLSSLEALYPILAKSLDKEDESAGKIWEELVSGRFEKLLTLPDYKIGVKDLFKDVEIPLAKVLFRLEKNGIHIDSNYLDNLGNSFNKHIIEAEKEIYDVVGHEFNISSSKQLADVLFNELQLPPVKKTKTGYSTASGVLNELRGLHPIVELIEKYREYSKLKSTYVDGVLPLIEDDGKIHTSFNQSTVVSGRLSSSSPNMQNIPKRSKVGVDVRRAFLPLEGGVLFAFDYSQIELRLAAHVANAKKMLKAFEEGEDVHSSTAAEVFDVDVKDVTKDQRAAAKTVNFAVLYGVSAYGLSQQLRNTPEEAAEIIESYFEKFPDIKNYIENVIELARREEKLETMFGRYVNVNNINSSNYQLKKAAERFAINFPMQGSAADIMKLSMIDVYSFVEDFKKTHPSIELNMLLQVHDEIVFEYKNSDFGKLKNLEDIKNDDLFIELTTEIKNIMQNVVALSVPLGVELEVGFNWGDMKEFSTQ